MTTGHVIPIPRPLALAVALVAALAAVMLTTGVTRGAVWSLTADLTAAGVHFLTFNPSSDDFRRNRLAMDGVLPDGTRLPLEPRSRAQGLNSVLRTSHRQNFLVPPRSRRSFPLVELLP